MKRQAYEQSLPIKTKTKFINLIAHNAQELSTSIYCKIITCYTIIAVIFFAFAIYFFIQVGNITQIRQQYYYHDSNKCKTGFQCAVSFTIEETMQQPVTLMYELGNFYQNQRRYILSKSNYQLAGYQISLEEANGCQPYKTNGQMGKTVSWNGTNLSANAVASPCGAIAFTFFTDTFSLSKNGSNIAIDETEITWPGDIGSKYKRGPSSADVQWMDPQDPHFVVWMRTSGLPNFKKPWGEIKENLEPGEYVMKIANNYNSSGWNGDRYFILSTSSFVGGKNFVLPVGFLLISLFSLVAVVIFCQRFRLLNRIDEEKQ